MRPTLAILKPDGSVYAPSTSLHYHCMTCDVMGKGSSCWLCGEEQHTERGERHRWPMPFSSNGHHTNQRPTVEPHDRDLPDLDGHLFDMREIPHL